MICIFILFFPLVLGVAAGIFVLMSISKYALYKKTGNDPFPALFPFYGGYLVMKSVGLGPMYFLYLIFYLGTIRFDGFIGFLDALCFLGISLYMSHTIAKRFGVGFIYVLGLAFLPVFFFPLLAFGRSDSQNDGFEGGHNGK